MRLDDDNTASLSMHMFKERYAKDEQGLQEKLSFDSYDKWYTKRDPTICSFMQIPIYTPNQYELLILGYCRIEYIDNYYDTEKYIFPRNIIQLISDYMYNEHYKTDINQPGLYSQKDKLKSLPKRISKEIQRLSKDSPPGISFLMHPENWRYFLIALEGPMDTPYEGGTFNLEMFLPKEYPMKPPKCRFLTPIIHTEVDKLGRICLDVLKDKWSGALTMSRVALSIQLLLQDPYPDDPLGNPYFHKMQMCRLYGLNDLDMSEIEKKIREATQKYAVYFPKI